MRTTARWYIKFLQWKTQYLTHRQFILLLCGLVGEVYHPQGGQPWDSLYSICSGQAKGYHEALSGLW